RFGQHRALQGVGGCGTHVEPAVLVIGEGGGGVRPRALGYLIAGDPVDNRQGHPGGGSTDHRVHTVGQYPVGGLGGDGLVATLIAGDRGRYIVTEYATGFVDLLDRV